MDSKGLRSEIDSFRKRLKQVRDQYSDLADNDLYVEVEDKARNAYSQLQLAQKKLGSLASALASVEEHLTALVEAERNMNARRKNAGEVELTTCHGVLKDFVASELFKLK